MDLSQFLDEISNLSLKRLALVMFIWTISWVIIAIVRGVVRRWREHTALTLAPAVYQAGGDAADVLRAIGDCPKTKSGAPAEELRDSEQSSQQG